MTLVFAIGSGMLVLALIASLFLREIPLAGRRPAASVGSELSEAAPEIVAEALL